MSETDLAEIWARSLNDLADMQIEPYQRAWLQLTRPLGLVENTALIATPNEFAKDQLENRLRSLITNALSRELGRNIQLAVIIDPAVTAAMPAAEEGQPGQDPLGIRGPFGAGEGQAEPRSSGANGGPGQGGFEQAGSHEQGPGYEQAAGYEQADGYDAAGYGRSGYNGAGYNSAGYDRAGYHAPGFDGAPYPQPGYDRPGYDRLAFSQPGYDRPGYDQPGYDLAGYDQPGYENDRYNGEPPTGPIGRAGGQTESGQDPAPPADGHQGGQAPLPLQPGPAGLPH
ncbi:MAG: hypothetical protein ACR2FU_14465, partial [Streptosporangiaceae bacterium]